MKTRIIGIHPLDAFYEDQAELLGMEVEVHPEKAVRQADDMQDGEGHHGFATWAHGPAIDEFYASHQSLAPQPLGLFFFCVYLDPEPGKGNS